MVLLLGAGVGTGEGGDCGEGSAGVFNRLSGTVVSSVWTKWDKSLSNTKTYWW